jgi:hypothetical protein
VPNLLQRILEYDRGVASGADAPVPSTGGHRIVCVVCPELLTEAAGGGVAARFGLDAGEVVLVAVPAARVARPDGEVARAVALVAAREGGDVVVLGHEACSYRAPAFPVPGTSPRWEAGPADAELVALSAANLRASPWMPRGGEVHAIVLDRVRRLRPAGEAEVVARSAEPPASATSRAAATTGRSARDSSRSSVGAAGSIVAPGPVSFFGATGAAPSLGSAPPSAPGPVTLGAPPPPEMPRVDFAPTPPLHPIDALRPGHVAPVPMTSAGPMVGPLAPVQPLAPPPPPTPVAPDALSWAAEPPPPPAPKRTPPPPRKAPPAEPPPVPRKADDPFSRAEEILERLRRERNKR